MIMKSMKVKISIVFVFAFIIGFFLVQTFILQSKGQSDSVIQKMPLADVAVEKQQISSSPDDAGRHDKKVKIVSAPRKEHIDEFLDSLFEDNGFFEPEETTFLEAIFPKRQSQRTYRIVLCDFDGFLFPIGTRLHRFFNQSLSPIFQKLKAAGVLLGGLPMEGEKKTEEYIPAFNAEFGGFNFFLDISDHFSASNPSLFLKGGVVWNIQSSHSTKGQALRDLLIYLRDRRAVNLKRVKLFFIDDSPLNLNSVIAETADLGLGLLVPFHYVKPLEVNLSELGREPGTFREGWKAFYRNLIDFWFSPSTVQKLP